MGKPSADLHFDSQANYYQNAYGESRDFRARWSLWTGIIDRYRPRSCLDIGCGPGLFSFHVAEKGIPTTGIDFSRKMIELCKAESARRGISCVDFLQASLPLPWDLQIRPADLVLCSSVLEYVEDLQGAISSIERMTAPGGHLLVSLPNGKSLFRQYEKIKYALLRRPSYYRHVLHLLPIRKALKIFEGTGFVPLEIRFYGDEPLLSKIGSSVSAEFGKNLFLIHLQNSR